MPFRQQFERFIRLIAEDFVEGFDLEFDCHIVLFFLADALPGKPSNVSQLLLTLSNFTPKQKNQLKPTWKG
ncbi:hypothetical protein JH254_18325 [Aeromonas caviae]|uniref:hypothetical protein n=1 Tax=Aeromonas caviae TaxID=648 RepID=UPI001908710A|nr:hypothetical protein [Aeromonas caviae]QQM77758.1 hypothetical protein JH254_18325 [Aeromonas caviae]